MRTLAALISRGHVNAPGYGWAFLQTVIKLCNEAEHEPTF